MKKTYRVLAGFENLRPPDRFTTEPTQRLEALVGVGYLEVEHVWLDDEPVPLNDNELTETPKAEVASKRRTRKE